MGQRSPYASVAQVLCAFIQRRTWKQAELARAVGLRPEALRRVLSELVEGGAPLTQEKEHPHVYWSVPRSWYPGAVLFPQELVPDLLRQLSRSRRGKAVERLLSTALDQLPGGGAAASLPVAAPATSETEEQFLPLVEDAARRRVPLAMRYVTGSSGQVGRRHASVQLVELQGRPRFVAVCHKAGELRRFRVDGIVQAHLDEGEPFRSAPEADVAAFVAASLDGFKGDGPPLTSSFFVREPECRWVVNNLLDGMRPQTLRDGIRVTVETAGMSRLAAFVVGLGGAVRPETPALARAVADLARGALQSADLALAGLDPSTGSDPSSSPPGRPSSGA